MRSARWTAVLFAPLFVSCSESGPAGPEWRSGIVSSYPLAASASAGGKKCASILITPATATIGVGGQVALLPTVLNKKGNEISGASVQWSTANINVAAVSATGIVTGIGAGTTSIIASCPGNRPVQGSVTITVN